MSIKIAFGAGVYGEDWNGFASPNQGSVLGPLHDDSLQPTPLTITCLYGLASYPSGRQEGHGPFPPVVQRNGFYSYMANTTAMIGYRLDGLDPQKQYSIQYLGSHDSTLTTMQQMVSINGVSQLHDATDPVGELISFEAISPTPLGVITILGETTAPGNFGWIGGIILDEWINPNKNLSSVTETVAEGGQITVTLGNCLAAPTAARMVTGAGVFALTLLGATPAGFTAQAPADVTTTAIRLGTYRLEVDVDGVTLSRDALTLTPGPGRYFGLFGAPHADPAALLVSVPSWIAGDGHLSFGWRDVSGAAVGIASVINANGTVQYPTGWTDGWYFDWRTWDSTDGTWGNTGRYTLSSNSPDPFTIEAEPGVEIGALVVSQPFSPSGYTQGESLQASVRDGLEYAISYNDGAEFEPFTSAPAFITWAMGSPRPVFVVRGSAPATFGVSVSRQFELGGRAAVFTITARPAVVPVLAQLVAARNTVDSITWSVSAEYPTGALFVLATLDADIDPQTVVNDGTPVVVAGSGVYNGELTGQPVAPVYLHVVHSGETLSEVLTSALVGSLPGHIGLPVNSILDIYDRPVTHVYDHWMLAQDDDMEATTLAGNAISVTARGTGLAVSAGGVAVEVSAVAHGNYTMVAWDGTGNIKAHYFRCPVIVGPV